MDVDGGDGRAVRGLRGFDVKVPNPARMWNYWIGGKDNFASDRETAAEVMAAMPAMPTIARSVRRFLIDAVSTLAAEYGVRQFLDIGTGLPTADNTHEVAQGVDPSCRVVYVDNDPVVISHARVLLTSAPEGRTDYVAADLRDADAIIAAARDVLDFSQPVAVLLLSVLHFIPDADDPHAVVRRLMDATPPGSFLVIAHAPSDMMPERMAELTRRYTASGAAPMRPRSQADVAAFFAGLEPIGPGVVPSAEWRWPGSDTPADQASRAGYVGVGRKPSA
jgi:O-methyltransferase involved in polyketide biosynthesis